MRRNTAVFVDTGPWIALALTRDLYHERAIEIWEDAQRSGARLFTSVPVILETFTFLERNTRRIVAIRWKDSLEDLSWLTVLDCSKADLDDAWSYFERKDLHKLSAVDATSFVLMRKNRIRIAFAFDTHFAAAGFRCLS